MNFDMEWLPKDMDVKFFKEKMMLFFRQCKALQPRKFATNFSYPFQNPFNNK